MGSEIVFSLVFLTGNLRFFFFFLTSGFQCQLPLIHLLFSFQNFSAFISSSFLFALVGLCLLRYSLAVILELNHCGQYTYLAISFQLFYYILL